MDRPGVILKICVRNFVTYTYAEMYPGPNLNMIIGPNGTGKSTMVAAIILGLGGNPKIVGRGNKVSEYVKHNCEQAHIDIILKANDSSDSNTVTVTRIFDLHDKSVWKIDGKKVSHKDMLEHMKDYNIQVNNLCQFLPQDRMQDFAKMNRQELLEQTKKALCRDDLIDKREKLVRKRERHRELLESTKKNTKKLQEAKDANSRLETKVANFNKRKNYLSIIKGIDRKMAWLNYEEIARRRDEMKNDKAQAAGVLMAHKKSAAPIEVEIKNAKAMASKLREQITQSNNNLKTLETEIQRNNDKVRKLKESIKELQSEMKSKIAEIVQRENEIRTANMKLAKLESDKKDLIEKYGSDAEIRAKIEQHDTEIRKISNQISMIETKKSELVDLKRGRMYEMRALENEVRKIENVKHQRLEYLRRVDSDAYNATLWLRENSRNFKGEVYEPMMLELNVISPENAIYIENTIPLRDRIAFTCTNKEDMNMLIRSFRDDQHFSVNIVYSDPEESVRMYRPNIPIEGLGKYGFFAYLASLLTGPSPVIVYLCKNYRIHSTPVGNDKTNQCFEDVPREISHFFSDKFKFSCSYSRYTGEKIVSQNEMKSDGCLSISVDVARLENIRVQLNEYQKNCEQYDTQIQAFENQIDQLNQRKERLTESLKGIRNVTQNIQTIDSRIRVASGNLTQLQQETVSEEDIRKETAVAIKKTIKQVINLQKVIKEKFKSLSSIQSRANTDQLKVNVSEKEVTFLENKAYDVRQLCEEAERTFQHIKTLYENITKDAKKALQKGKDLSNGFTPDQEGFNDFREAYDKLEDDPEELERHKNEVVGRMECLNTADEAEMREYEERMQLIEQLEDSLRNNGAEIGSFERKMEKMELDYVTPLQELVDQISSRFSAAFERMGCAGAVSIYKGDSDKDYEHYGLSIKVTYRNGEPLQELNNITQSGGERAVATATYMLSLQELTPVPFRCVDEINQGMDEINERRIFELLFESTSQPNTSQYFLITPKLISNLNYVRTMKVHFVHNGPFVVSQTAWNSIKV